MLSDSSSITASFPPSKHISEVRALPSAGITRLHRYVWPSPSPRLAAALSATLGLPHRLRASLNYPDHLLCMPCSLPRWIGSGACRLRVWRAPAPGFFPVRAGLPRHQGRVGIHNFPFEACSSFTRVTACRVARPPNRGLCREAPPGRLPSRTARQLPSHTDILLGWVLPPLVICAVEAHHCVARGHAPGGQRECTSA